MDNQNLIKNIQNAKSVNQIIETLQDQGYAESMLLLLETDFDFDTIIDDDNHMHLVDNGGQELPLKKVKSLMVHIMERKVLD